VRQVFSFIQRFAIIMLQQIPRISEMIRPLLCVFLQFLGPKKRGDGMFGAVDVMCIQTILLERICLI
jgi:hypothetical protein